MKRFRICLPALAVLGAAAPAAQALETVKIGVLLPYAPPFEIYARAMETTIKMALDEIGGAVAGRKIELIFENDGNKPTQALVKAKKLIGADRVAVLMGGLASNLALPLHQEAVAARQPTIILNAGIGSITGKDCSPWVMRVSFSADQIIRDSGAWLFKRGFRRAAIATADYAGGRDVAGSFKREFTKAGGAIVAEIYAPFATKDFGPYFAQAKAAMADTIYSFFPGGMAIQFVQEYEKFGLKGHVALTGPAWTVGPAFLARQGKGALGFVGPINYVPSLDNAANRRFAAEFRKRSGGRDPDEVTVNGYDAMHMVAAGLKTVRGNTADKAALMAAIRNAEYSGPRGPMRIDPRTNNVIQNVYMVEVKEVGGKPTHVVVDTIKDVRDPPNGCAM